MSMLVVAALVLAYLCVVAFVMAMLAAASRADAAIDRAFRALCQSDARWDDRRMAEEGEEPSAEMSAHRRAG